MSFFGNRRQAEPVPPIVEHEKPALPKPALPPAPVGFETVLGANSVMEGVLRSNANARLDGTFTGTLEITGNVLVGETAKINADINARNISIAGAVRGNINGKKVQLLRTGRIWGDIRATALTTEEGAFIDGKITMVSQEAAVPVENVEDKKLLSDVAAEIMTDTDVETVNESDAISESPNGESTAEPNRPVE